MRHLWIAILVGSFGCADDAPPADPAPPNEEETPPDVTVATFTISSFSGGVAVSVDGKLSIVVPSGTFDRDVELSIEQDLASPAPAVTHSGTYGITIEPSAAVASSPMNLQVTFLMTEAEVAAGGGEAALTIAQGTAADSMFERFTPGTFIAAAGQFNTTLERLPFEAVVAVVNEGDLYACACDISAGTCDVGCDFCDLDCPGAPCPYGCPLNTVCVADGGCVEICATGDDCSRSDCCPTGTCQPDTTCAGLEGITVSGALQPHPASLSVNDIIWGELNWGVGGEIWIELVDTAELLSHPTAYTPLAAGPLVPDRCAGDQCSFSMAGVDISGLTLGLSAVVHDRRRPALYAPTTVRLFPASVVSSLQASGEDYSDAEIYVVSQVAIDRVAPLTGKEADPLLADGVVFGLALDTAAAPAAGVGVTAAPPPGDAVMTVIYVNDTYDATLAVTNDDGLFVGVATPGTGQTAVVTSWSASGSDATWTDVTNAGTSAGVASVIVWHGE